MSKKPAVLPNIEDAMFAACLAPRATAIIPDRDTLPPVAFAPDELAFAASVPRSPRAEVDARGTTSVAPTAEALAEWRSLAQQDFATLCAMRSFLSKSDVELSAAMRQYPRPVLGFLAQLSRMEQRRARQLQAMIELRARLQTAMLEAASEPRFDVPHLGKVSRDVG